jgi:PTH1 family peptidyl-tRNA hydrolase
MPDGEKALRIVAGLGNPGREYCETRHNAGWLALDELARQCGADREESRSGGALVRCGGLWLFKPFSYMNLSGPPIARLWREAGIPVEGLLAVVDDMNLPLGMIRLRAGGSSGGHKGLASLIESLGTEAFPRLRLGIGPCPPEVEGRDFVLSPFLDAEWEAVERMTGEAAEAALCWAGEGMVVAMNRFNRKADEQ